MHLRWIVPIERSLGAQCKNKLTQISLAFYFKSGEHLGAGRGLFKVFLKQDFFIAHTQGSLTIVSGTLLLIHVIELADSYAGAIITLTQEVIYCIGGTS